MITVDDRIVEEARLFPEEGGVSMTVVARRPIYYVVSHSGDELSIHVEPATLLAAEPTGPIAVVEKTPTGGARDGAASSVPAAPPAASPAEPCKAPSCFPRSPCRP